LINSEAHLEVLQIVGGTILVLISLVLVWVFRNCRFALFRNEAMACAVVSILIIGIGRLLLGLGLISRSEMLSSTAMLEFVPFAILAELIVIAYRSRDNPMLHGSFR